MIRMNSPWMFITAWILIMFMTQCRPSDNPTSMKIKKEPWGTTSDGKPVFCYTLDNGKGVETKITNYGGIIVSIRVPDRNGVSQDVVLGFDSLQPYLKGHPYFGALVGRVANRIAKGKFVLDGLEYRLAVNNGPNSLHGGIKGFDKVVWDAQEYRDSSSVGLRLTYRSIDGEEGYPGNMDVKVLYQLTLSNELKISFEAGTDRPTPVNLASHSYFNLKGTGSGDVLDHILSLNAAKYVVVDSVLIPTGELRPVMDTPFDFRAPAGIGERISEIPGGYDHTFVLDTPRTMSMPAAILYEPTSGRKLEIFTTQPGVQLYTGNFLDGSLVGKEGRRYGKHAGLCLETQHFPDSPNQKRFPDVILRPGQIYRHQTTYRFSVQ